jgi:hypothetical protein
MFAGWVSMSTATAGSAGSATIRLASWTRWNGSTLTFAFGSWVVRDREQRRGRKLDPAWANRRLLLRG